MKKEGPPLEDSMSHTKSTFNCKEKGTPLITQKEVRLRDAIL